MKNLKSKLAKEDPRLRMVQGMVWSVIRLIAVEILASIAGRGLGQGK